MRQKQTLLNFLLVTMLALMLASCNLAQQTGPSAPLVPTAAAQPAPQQPAAAQPPADQATQSNSTVVQDNTPPAITLPQTQQLVAFYAGDKCGFTTFQVEFQVTDETTLANVRVDYRMRAFDGDAAMTFSLPATSGENGYTFTLPVADIWPSSLRGQPGLLEYSVVAADGAGNETRLPGENSWLQVVTVPCTDEVAALLQANPPSATVGTAQGAWNQTNLMVCPPNCFNLNSLPSAAFCLLHPTDPSCAASSNAGAGGSAGNSSAGGSSSGGSAGSSSAGGSSSGGSAGNSSAGGSSSGGSAGGSSAGGSSSGGTGDTATVDPCLLNPSDPNCITTVNIGNSGGGTSGSSGGGISVANPCDVNPSDPSCTTTVGTGNTLNEPIITPVVNP